MKNILMIGLATILIVGCGGQNFTLPSQNNNFQQTPLFNNKVDILIMADDSSNMQKYQNSLAGQMASMIAKLDSMGMDYQIAVTSSSLGNGFTGGKFLGSPKVITKGNPNRVGLINSRMQVGQAGSDLEQGLGSVKAALSPGNLTGESAAFLRSDALLAVIVLSNEDDYSASNVKNYSDFFDNLKKPFSNGARSWIFNFLGVTSLDPSCPTQVGVVTEYIEVGLRYMALADYSDGVNESICGADWSQVVANVRVRINQVMTDYYLNVKPLLTSLFVSINGKTIVQDAVNGWSYHEKTEGLSTKFFVRFHGTSIPTFFDNILVKFDPAGPK